MFLYSGGEEAGGSKASLDLLYGFLSVFDLGSLVSSGNNLLLVTLELAYVTDSQLIFHITTPVSLSVNQSVLGWELHRQVPVGAALPPFGGVHPGVTVRDQKLVPIIQQRQP